MAERTNEWPPDVGRSDESAGLLERLTRYVPDGHSIPADAWRRRHRNIVLLLLAHVPALFALGLYEGTESISGATIPAYPLPEVLLRLGALLGFALLASWPRLGRRVRTSLVTIGLATGSAVLVYFSGGLIEAHFHFFVVMGVVAVYEDWLPFLLGIVYVALQHGYFGMTSPEAVYNHTAAINSPFVWAFIHAAFVLALAAALMTNWYSIERSRERARQRLQETQAAEEARADVEAKQREVEQLNEHLETTADAYSATMARAADGDLGARLDPESESESEAMVRIAESYNEMMTELESTLREIQTFARDVTTASEEANAGANEVKAASESVRESVQTISEGTETQRGMLEEVAAEMNDLSATVQEVASSAEGVAETSHETATVAEAGEETARRAIDDTKKAQSAIGTTVEHVERLDDQMTEIGDIVELIGDIAEQTNMLALNANIEAARFSGGGSGSGDGFAVVADEVKQLAEETRESATDIEQLIGEIQGQTERTLAEARTADQHMEESVAAVDDVVDAFSQVTTNAEETDSGIREISAATDEQAVSAEETVSMVEDVAEISRTTADEADGVSAAANEQASSISQVSANVAALTEQAEQLQALLATFDVSAAQSAIGGSQSADTSSGADVALGDGGR